MSANEVGAVVRERFPDTIVARDEVTVVIDRDDLLEALAWLRDEPRLRLDLCSSVTATHWPGRQPAFWVVYEMRSLAPVRRCRVKVGLADDDAHVPSITAMFPTANWHERETWDFFGVTFDGHPDLTRILLPDDWEGHPLRKDEELGGVNTPFKNGGFHPPVDKRTPA